jgi:tRNA(adenine34) deaminase|tara:strand:+ start:9920 stop:10375 length:456 start_codon:yes stop_codon:yes gene_type:complete
MFSDSDHAFMQEAIQLAKEAALVDEVPVGAVITLDNKIIGRGFNQVISMTDVTAHAEILAIKDASQTIQNYRLKNTCIYVTLEPCHMCAKALIDARVSRLVYSSFEPKTGAITSIDNLYNKPFNHKIDCEQGLLEQETSKILKDFFKTKRN